MQIGQRSKSHMHKDSDKEAENAHSQRLRREDQTAQHSAANADNIAHSWHLRWQDQTARCSTAAFKKSCQVKPEAPDPAPAPAPAPLIGSRVTRCQGKNSMEASMASAADPFTYAEAMESPQRNHWKSALEEESTSILVNNTFSTLNSRKAQQLQVKPINSK